MAKIPTIYLTILNLTWQLKYENHWKFPYIIWKLTTWTHWLCTGRWRPWRKLWKYGECSRNLCKMAKFTIWAWATVTTRNSSRKYIIRLKWSPSSCKTDSTAIQASMWNSANFVTLMVFDIKVFGLWQPTLMSYNQNKWHNYARSTKGQPSKFYIVLWPKSTLFR